MNTRWSILFAAGFVGPAALLGTLSGCANAPYVWVAELPNHQAVSSDYVVEPGDVLNVRVFNQDAMSTRAKVRNDGKISVPFAGEVDVGGKAPGAIAKELEQRLRSYVVTPIVTVTVDEFQQPTVAVVGEVTHPGVYNIDQSAGVLKALALAGGMTDYASHDNIYVLRRAVPSRIRFTYRALTDNEVHASAFRLRGGDTVVVE